VERGPTFHDRDRRLGLQQPKTDHDHENGARTAEGERDRYTIETENKSALLRSAQPADKHMHYTIGNALSQVEQS
jgi:hypothetical protein